LFAGSFISVNADCFYQEIDPPICSISGETYTSSCQGWSDTSSWAIPKAYNGSCNVVAELSDAEKDAIHNIVLSYLGKKGYLEEKGDGYVLTGDSFMGETGTGIDFVKNKFFPAIAKFIAKENAKTEANTKIIAILNEAVKVIGYDWYIEKK
jgi:hypothetical protein